MSTNYDAPPYAVASSLLVFRHPQSTFFPNVIDCVSYPYQHSEDEDRDGLQNAGFFTIQPPDPANSLRELHYISLPYKMKGKHYSFVHFNIYVS
jgi:hypothetical protein